MCNEQFKSLVNFLVTLCMPVHGNVVCTLSTFLNSCCVILFVCLFVFLYGSKHIH